MPCTNIELLVESRRLVLPAYTNPVAWENFNNNVLSHYAVGGCAYLQNRYWHFFNQLANNTYGVLQTAIKTAKRDYFLYMYTFCGCGPSPIVSPSPQASLASPIIDPTILTAPIIKKISSFNMDFTDLSTGGGIKNFTIEGDNGASFYLEITNEDSPKKYYNPVTKTFTTKYARFDGELENYLYSGNIKFPAVTDDDQYDIYLYTNPNTIHAERVEKRFRDGSIDLNSSTGSSSMLLQKVIYQVLDVDLVISALSPTAALSMSGNTNATISTFRYQGKESQPFSITANFTSNAITVDQQPSDKDVLAVFSATVGSAPIQISGENIYPAITNADTVDGAIVGGGSVVKVVMDSSVASKMIVGDKITAATSTDTIDGKMAIGDQITGSEIADGKLVTVAALNPDGDNVKEFSMSEEVALTDGERLVFSPKCNRSLTTVVTLNPDTDNVKEFAMSQNVGFVDGVTLSFSKQLNYQWPINNAKKLKEDMIVIKGTNLLTNTTLAKYEEITTINADTIYEEEILVKEVDAVDTSDSIPTILKGIETTAPGNIVFNQQQPVALAGDVIKIGGYGLENVKLLTDWDISIDKIELTLNTVTTTTTSAIVNDQIIPVTSALGIAGETQQTVDGAITSSNRVVLDSVDGLFVGQTIYTVGSGSLSGNPTITSINKISKAITLSSTQTFADGITLSFANSTVSGIGIDPDVINPHIRSISSLNLTSGVAQTLESGQTLTFLNAGNTATITGNISIKKVGAEALNLYFDVERFLTYHS